MEYGPERPHLRIDSHVDRRKKHYDIRLADQTYKIPKGQHKICLNNTHVYKVNGLNFTIEASMERELDLLNQYLPNRIRPFIYSAIWQQILGATLKRLRRA